MELIESFDNFDNFMVIFFPQANKRARVRIHFTICSSLLDSIIVSCRCNNRIRATVKIVFKLLAHLWGILRFYDVTIRIEIGGEKNLYKRIVPWNRRIDLDLFVIVNLNIVFICSFPFTSSSLQIGFWSNFKL